MNKYTKGKNVIEKLEKHNIPIPDLPDDFVWMIVSCGSKIRNLLEAAWREFETKKHIVWSGSGPALSKTITCAEITKRKFKNLNQRTQICYRKEREYWDPKNEELDQLVVVREYPAIHILLSAE